MLPSSEIEADDDEEVAHRLVHLHALLLHFLRKQRHGERDFVLHLHLRDVRIGAAFEGDGERQRARRGALRLDVAQVVDAVELLLDDLRDGVFERLGRSAGISRDDADGRRREARELRDGQARDRERAREHDEDGDDPREDGPVDEESGHRRFPFEWPDSVRGGGRRRRRRRAAGATLTGAPGRIRWRLSTMTWSPGFNPAETSHWLPTARGVWSTRSSAVPFAPTTIVVGSPFELRVTASCGTRMASGELPSSSRARTNKPGSRSPRGFGKIARTVTEFVVAFTVTSETSSVPSSG